MIKVEQLSRRTLMRAILAGVFLTGGIALAVAELSAADHPPADEATHSTEAAPADHGAHAGEHHGGEEHEASPITWQADLAIWTLVTFFVFVTVLKKFAWGPLIEGLDNREARVLSEIEQAEQARKKAEQMLADYNEQLAKAKGEVEEMLVQARKDADVTKEKLLSEAREETRALRQRTLDDISRAKDAALKELFDQVNAQVVDATEYVLGRSLEAADRDRLIDEALAQLSGTSD